MNSRRKSGNRCSPAAALAVCLALTASAPAEAQQPAAETPGAPRTVALFDAFCYSTLPDLAAIEQFAAKGKWQPITGATLQAFKPSAGAEVLKAWNLGDLGVPFRLAVSRSAMDAQAARDFPAFAKATVYACSLILPGKTASAEIAAAMQKLMERKNDESFEQGPMTVSAWSGATEKLAVTIQHYRPKSGQPGGLLSVTLMQNP